MCCQINFECIYSKASLGSWQDLELQILILRTILFQQHFAKRLEAMSITPTNIHMSQWGYSRLKPKQLVTLQASFQ